MSHSTKGGPDDNSAQAGHLIVGTVSSLMSQRRHDPDTADQLVAFQQNSRSEVRLIGPNGEGDHVGAIAAEPGAQQQNYRAGGAMVRRLTPTECERLQSLPDGWTLLEESDDPNPKPDSPRYAACGDAVTSNVAQWIGERILAYDP